MRHLILMRHGKSSWKDPALPDMERPLNRRGQSDVPMMAARLKQRGVRPDHVISSSAVRALATARLVVAELGLPAACIEERAALYTADAGDLLAMIRHFPADWQQPMLFVHNPAVTDVVNVLTDEIIENVPTCGVVEITFACDDWAALEVGSGHLAYFDFPKSELD